MHSEKKPKDNEEQPQKSSPKKLHLQQVVQNMQCDIDYPSSHQKTQYLLITHHLQITHLIMEIHLDSVSKWIKHDRRARKPVCEISTLEK